MLSTLSLVMDEFIDEYLRERRGLHLASCRLVAKNEMVAEQRQVERMEKVHPEQNLKARGFREVHFGNPDRRIGADKGRIVAVVRNWYT